MTELTQVEQALNSSSVGKWKTYPVYKDSGIEWLGGIPIHWEIMPAWALFKLGRGRVISNLEIQDNPGQYPVYSSQTEDEGILGYINTYQFDGTYLTWTTDGANAGTVFYRYGKFNCTNVCGTLFPKEHQNDLGFFRYALSCSTFWYVRHDINPKLMNGVMARIRVQVPSFSEQYAIATFLDRETSKINTLIAKKERLIELLKEKRAALISHAVTKGLDPDAKMKDSGVEWLGEIPEHWEVRRLKFVTSFITSGSRGWAQYYSDEGAIFLRIGNLSRTSILLDLGDIQYVLHPSGTEGERTRVKQNDVLISITAYIGSIGVVQEDLGDAYVNQHIALTRPRRDIVDSRWLGQCLLSRVGQDQFQMLLNGGTKDGLGLDDVGNLQIIMPPLLEQQAIATYLEQETAKIDALISKVGEAIEKLKEYSTALISAAVTGKIDVRGEVAIADEVDSGIEELV